jgi:hypothetical protein
MLLPHFELRNERIANVHHIKVDERNVFFGDREIIKAVFIACFDVRHLPLSTPILIGLKLLIRPIRRFAANGPPKGRNGIATVSGSA